jgi:hypothetical protein
VLGLIDEFLAAHAAQARRDLHQHHRGRFVKVLHQYPRLEPQLLEPDDQE